jgi:hypothetical protein
VLVPAGVGGGLFVRGGHVLILEGDTQLFAAVSIFAGDSHLFAGPSDFVER